MIAKRARAHKEFVVLPAKYKKGVNYYYLSRETSVFLLSAAYFLSAALLSVERS
jgi:hypothetical protein